MECFGTTDFVNNSRLITLSAIIISDLHINKLCNVASYWIYVGILLGAHPILHISRIRVEPRNIPLYYSSADFSVKCTGYKLRHGSWQGLIIITHKYLRPYSRAQLQSVKFASSFSCNTCKYVCDVIFKC
jgi:hypothetical protein